MKLDVLNDSLSTTDVAKMSVNVDNLTYSLMIDGIYTNKLDSVVRELSTNARDSQISAGNKEPFLITLTYNENSNDVSLSIKDYGLGLNKEEAETYLCNLNSSNKRESNEAVGCFGIGSKSPFSLVDSYDFNCIKDGELTSLNLFRIKSETPRFLIATAETEEENSVECIVKLNSYSLKDILQTVYTELALFDIKPRIHLKSQRVDVLLEPEEFFCTVVETDNFYHLFYKEPDDKIKEHIPSIASNYPDFYSNLKNKKKISCGIIGYSSDDVSSLQENYSTSALQDYYILKFGLDSDIKFDVSRENIVKDSHTDKILKDKIYADFESIDLIEAIKFRTLYNIITNPAMNSSNLYNPSLLEEICPEFLRDLEAGLYLPEEVVATEGITQPYISPYRRNRDINYVFLFSKLEESFFYYQNNLKELSIIAFITKTRIRSNMTLSDTTSSRALNHILNAGRAPFMLSIISLLEKIVSNNTVIWKELYLENIINLTPDFNFLGTLAYSNFLKGYRNNPEVKVKEKLFRPKNISDLENFKFVIISNHKRLQSVSALNRFENSYRDSSYSDNTMISLLSGNKKSVIDKELSSNLSVLSSKNCISIFDLESYNEVNPLFVSDVKYVAPPRPVRRRAATTRVAINEEGEEELVTITHNEFGVKLRNKLQINIHKFNSREVKTLDITSLKFYEYLIKSYENSPYTAPKNLLLVSKDIVKTQEEKTSLLESESYITAIKLIFEIDNTEYYDQIKDVCICFLKQWNFKNDKAPIIELNSKFLDEETIKEYSKILIWMYNKTLNFDSFKNFIESIESDPDSRLFSEEVEEDTSNINRYNAPAFIEDTTVTRKAISFCNKLNISVNNPYKTGVYHQVFTPNDLPFKNISVLFNESLIDLETYSVRNDFYTKESFINRNLNSTNDFFDKLNTLKLTTLDSLLCINDNFLYNRLFNLEYLNTIQENYNEPLISFNAENFKKLIKEY